MTVQEMYDYTLEQLNKEATSSIFPDEWEILINASQLEKVQNVYAEVEKDQKRIDDLRMIIVGPSTISNSGTNTPGGEIFSLPFVENPASGGSHGYMFLLSAAFRITYVNSKCGTGLSDLIKGKPLRRDRRYEMTNDPYSKASDSRLYYFLQGNDVRLLTGTDSYGSQMVVEYLRYPIRIELVNNTVDCELPPHMHKEICDLATRKYLEQTESPRYQTYFTENQTSNQ
jgi:hypothetical protein